MESAYPSKQASRQMIAGDFPDVGQHDKTRSLKVEIGSNKPQPTKNLQKKKIQKTTNLYNDNNKVILHSYMRQMNTALWPDCLFQ